MPTYEWECPACQVTTETIQSFNDPPPDCDACKAPMKRLMSLPCPPFMGGLEGKLRSGKAAKARADAYNKSPAGKAEIYDNVVKARKRAGIDK